MQMAIADPAARTEVRAACPHDCPDTCAMFVTVESGVVTGVRADPDHPFTAGALCPKVNDYERRVNSPDRVLHPMRRTGAKGEGRFEQISWDAALDEIAERFTAIAGEHGPEAILPYSYLGTQGMLNGLAVGDPFFHRLGATVSERTFCDSGSSTAYTMTVGPTAGMDPESFEHSRCILLWACNVQSTNLHMWKFIARAQKAGATVIAIDPMRTRTARQADWHIPIRPGTDAALALGMAHVIVRDGLVDADYVARHTVGFEPLRERLAEYPPETVERITGVAAADVERLGRTYATTQPAAIRVGVAIERHRSGGQAVRAITSLPALTGAWRRPGGGILQLTHYAFPVNGLGMSRPDWIRPGTRVVNQWQLGAALTGELALDPPVKALFVYNTNPAVVVPDQRRVLEGLRRDDLFCVVGEQFLTDTARHADIVLPNTTQAEQLDLVFSWGQLYLTLNEPAVEPIGEAVSNREMFGRLARRMGFEDELFGLSDEQVLRDVALDWSHPSLAGLTMDTLRETGWARLSVPPPSEYAPHAEGGFPTPSGRCELYASLAEELGDYVVPFFRQWYGEQQSGAPVDPLPAYVEPPTDPAFPLALLSPKAHAFLNSCYGNMERQLRLMGGSQPVILHPLDAAERAIADGDAVTLRSAHGAMDGRAQLSEDVARGVVVSPVGYWLDAEQGATVNAVTATGYADMGRAPVFSDTRVEVSPAAPPRP
jgi:anaerobic selenocysteine-containing dehydrogenase